MNEDPINPLEDSETGNGGLMTQERLSDADEGRIGSNGRLFLLKSNHFPGEEPQVRNDHREQDADQRHPIK